MKLVKAATETPAWKATLEKLGWTPVFLAGDAYKKFLEEDTKRIAGIIESLGLRSRCVRRSRAEIALSIGVLALGAGMRRGHARRCPRRAATPASARTSSRRRRRGHHPVRAVARLRGASPAAGAAGTTGSEASTFRNEPPFCWITAGLFAHMALIGSAGFRARRHRAVSPASRAASAAGARPRRRRRPRCPRGVLVLRKLLNVNLPAAGSAAARRAGSAMEPLRALIDGFGVALQPINLLWGFIGVTLGTRSACCRASAPRSPWRCCCRSPRSSTDRRAHHVRRHLLRRHVRRLDHHHPAQHAGRIGLDRHRARGQQDGATAAPARRSRRARSAPSSPARIATVAAHAARAAGGGGRAQVRAGGVLRADGVRLHHRVGGARRLDRARPDEPVPRPALGLVGIDSQTGAPRFAFGVPELLDGVDVVVLAVGLFAVGEALYVAAYRAASRERARR